MGNDFHTYSGCRVALFHYIALQMTDSSVINFRLDLVVPHLFLSLIIEGIFLCWERLLRARSLFSLHLHLCLSSSHGAVRWTGSQSSHKRRWRGSEVTKELWICCQKAWSSSIVTCEFSAHSVLKLTNHLQERFLFCRFFWLYSKKRNDFFTTNSVSCPFAAIYLIR